jgi:hypothetical protein
MQDATVWTQTTEKYSGVYRDVWVPNVCIAQGVRPALANALARLAETGKLCGAFPGLFRGYWEARQFVAPKVAYDVVLRLRFRAGSFVWEVWRA